MNRDHLCLLQIMLAKGLAVVTVDHEERVGVQATRSQPIEEFPECGIAEVQCIEILVGIVRLGKRSGLRCRIRVMAGDGKILQKEPLAAWQRWMRHSRW